MLETTIANLRTRIDGKLSSKSRIVDGLLDLRLAAGDNEELIAEIDSYIVDIPGLTTVSTEWWIEKLDALELMSVTAKTLTTS